MKWFLWYLWVRREVERGYRKEGAIEAAAILAAYGYAKTMPESMHMARWLAAKHGWRVEEA